MLLGNMPRCHLQFQLKIARSEAKLSVGHRLSISEHDYNEIGGVSAHLDMKINENPILAFELSIVLN